MRFFFIILAVAFAVVAGAYSSDKVADPIHYGNKVSLAFAAGDSDDRSGWRECAKIDDTFQQVGVLCEGRRSIAMHGGQMVNVNYFCEFQFQLQSDQKYSVEHALCL